MEDNNKDYLIRNLQELRDEAIKEDDISKTLVLDEAIQVIQNQ